MGFLNRFFISFNFLAFSPYQTHTNQNENIMKIKTGRGTITLMVLVAIYSISMVTSLPGLAISPILGHLETIFKDASELQLQMLESLPSFIIVPFILLAGRLSLHANKKKLLIIGLSIFFICSIAYPLANKLWLLLLISAILGIGAGMVIPFSTGLVADYFSGKHRTRQLGLVSSITNISLVLATLFAGFLAGVNWHLSFLVYALSGISLFFAFFLDNKPPYKQSAAPKPASSKPAGSFRFDWPIRLMLFYYFITLLALNIPFNLSLYMHNLKVGNYDTSGTLISVFFLAMTLPGLFINNILSKLKANTNFIALCCISIGLLPFTVKSGLLLLIIGVILIGLGYGIMQPIIYDKTAAGVPPANATYALALVMVMNYVAIITYPFILEGVGDLFKTSSPCFPFIFSTVISVAFTLFAFFRRKTETLGILNNE